MRVLQIIQKDQPRGAEIFASQLSRHLRDQGHQVLIISLFRYKNSNQPAGDHIALQRSSLLRFFDPIGWWLLNRYIRKFKPDIIQANAGDTLKYAVFSRIVFRWKSTLIFRNANLMSSFATSFLKKTFNSWLLSKTDHIISVSPRCSDDLSHHFFIPTIKRSVVPIGIEEKQPDELHASLKSFIAEGSIITHIGSFVSEKNHIGLLRIFKLIVQKIPNAKLILVGEGHLRSSIREEVIRNNLDKCIHFTGAVENVYSILKASQVFLLPSRTEGMPAVLIEAMFCGCLVVAYRVGGIPDLVIHSQTGFLAEPENEEQMADLAIKILIPESQQKFEVIRRNAIKLVKDQYLNSQIVSRFAEVYGRLIRQHPVS